MPVGGTTIDGEEARHAVMSVDSDFSGTVTSTLDGFRIVNGRSTDHGAGLLVTQKRFAVRGCVFEDNRTTDHGGGAAFLNCPSVTVDGCRFEGNEAEDGAGGLHASSAPLRVQDSVFEGNSAVATDFATGGGVMTSGFSAVTVRRVTFRQNRAS